MRHIDNVIEANRDAGGTFFDKRTILYFKSKVLPTLYGGKYFITYDLTEDGKRYSVREVLSNGLIKQATLGLTHKTLKAAKGAISLLRCQAITA